jgi:hypothetical protein
MEDYHAAMSAKRSGLPDRGPRADNRARIGMQSQSPDRDLTVRFTRHKGVC